VSLDDSCSHKSIGQCDRPLTCRLRLPQLESGPGGVSDVSEAPDTGLRHMILASIQPKRYAHVSMTAACPAAFAYLRSSVSRGMPSDSASAT